MFNLVTNNIELRHSTTAPQILANTQSLSAHSASAWQHLSLSAAGRYDPTAAMITALHGCQPKKGTA